MNFLLVPSENITANRDCGQFSTRGEVRVRPNTSERVWVEDDDVEGSGLIGRSRFPSRPVIKESFFFTDPWLSSIRERRCARDGERTRAKGRREPASLTSSRTTCRTLCS